MYSRRWIEAGLREWVCQVAQAAYGHRARKLTWLLYGGRRLPELDWSVPKVNAIVTLCWKGRKLRPAAKASFHIAKRMRRRRGLLTC